MNPLFTNPLITNLLSIIKDNSGELSSIRVLMLIWGGGTFFVWAFGCILNFWYGKFEFIAIPGDIITILLGVTGLKVGQRFTEKPIAPETK